MEYNSDNPREDTMPEPDLDLGPEPEPEVTRPGAMKPKKERNKKLIVAWILVVLMTLAAAAFAWLYFNKEAEPQEQSEDATAETSQESDTEEEEAVPSGTSYEAEVGKFTLKLDSAYVVIERLDGPFEGGPATAVDIGEKEEGSSGVIQTSPAQAFSIFARPEDGATLASNSRVDALEDNELATRQADTTFADTPARVYQEDGLFIVRHIVFVKNDKVYAISLLNEDSAQAATYKAVEAGFTFVE